MAGLLSRLRTRFGELWNGTFRSGKGSVARARILAWWEPGPVQLASALLVLALGVGAAAAFVSTGSSAASGGVPSADARYGGGDAAVRSEDATSARPLEAWLADLRDPTPRVRWTAVQALGHLGAGGAGAGGDVDDIDDIVAALVGALKDDHFMVRADAATALGAIGPAADEAVSGLIAASHDPAAAVRAAATAALPRIRPSPAAVTLR